MHTLPLFPPRLTCQLSSPILKIYMFLPVSENIGTSVPTGSAKVPNAIEFSVGI